MHVQFDPTLVKSLVDGPPFNAFPTLLPQSGDEMPVLEAKELAALASLVPNGSFAAITPSDSTNLTPPTRSIYVGVTGDVTVTNEAGENVTFTAVPAGAVLPIATSRVMATGTTATGLIAL